MHALPLVVPGDRRAPPKYPRLAGESRGPVPSGTMLDPGFCRGGAGEKRFRLGYLDFGVGEGAGGAAGAGASNWPKAARALWPAELVGASFTACCHAALAASASPVAAAMLPASSWAEASSADSASARAMSPCARGKSLLRRA